MKHIVIDVVIALESDNKYHYVNMGMKHIVIDVVIAL